MWIFRRKKQTEPAPEPIKTPCELGDHLWKDFPPYLVYNNKDGYEPIIEVVENYVCCLCHKRKSVTLERFTYSRGISNKVFAQKLEEVQTLYKDILRPKAIVEDMIQDHIHLDKLKLKYWEHLNLPKEDLDDDIPSLTFDSK